MSLPIVNLGLDYSEETETIRTFLEKFTTTEVNVRVEDAGVDGQEDEDVDMVDLGTRPGSRKYMDLLQRIADRETDALEIDLEDVAADEVARHLVPHIVRNTQRYIRLFSSVVDQLLPQPSRDLSGRSDILDVIQFQREAQNEQNAEDGVAQFPPELLRRYTLYFRPLASDRVLSVREMRGLHLGSLVTLQGIVTRVSDVKPLLLVNAYTCDMCGAEVFQEVDKRRILPLTECPSQTCQQNNTKGQLHMQTRASKFTPFQEVKVQEVSSQVPVGHIPRSTTVHLYGPLTRTLNPGEIVNIAGIFMPIPYEGIRALRLGLLTDSYLEAQHVHQLKKQYDAMALTPQLAAELETLREEPNVYDKLAASIAPEIYGHTDVKKALLLLLVGGVTKNMPDGMKIRGDLNVCLMGDPGVAKSQLLKYISKVAPRGVYSTGRGSSGVGLTAAVMKDPLTGEFVLEGGALVLADNGIACIDEFDKMAESDRTAIHEVMEQQTISISKAGITTSLNARTSILAAANPLYGRYNPRVSPVENINLPAALLSRFDLLFLILDTPSREDDERLAEHVTYVHMHSEHPQRPGDLRAVSPALMRHYIAQARTVRPVVPPNLVDRIVGSYVSLREETLRDESDQFTYTSARTLLGVVRLAQAHARLRFSSEVSSEDIDEALRLMKASKASLHDDEPDTRTDRTAKTQIYELIREMALSGDPEAMDVDGAGPTVRMSDLRQRVFARGFTEAQLDDCLVTYSGLGIWTVDSSSSVLTLMDDQMEEE